MNRQRGVMVFLVPLVMVTIVLLGTLAIDGARLYSLRQEMQSQVNAAATAAADAAQACGGQAVNLGTIRQRALVAARAQGFEGSDDDLIITPGLIESDADKVLSFEPVTNLLRSNGVAVTYRKETPVSVLLPESFLGSVTLEASTAARKELVATLSGAGSTAILGGTQRTANLLNTLLGEVLNDGQPFSMDLTDFQDIAGATARLGGVLSDLGVSNVEDLVGTQVLVSDLLKALRDNDESLEGLGGALDEVIESVGGETIKISDLIQIVGASEIPENSRLPVYDTVIAIVLNLAEGTLIEGALGATQIDIPNVTDTKIDLFIGKAPKVVTGPARHGEEGQWMTRFYAPDITLMVTSKLNVLNLMKLELPLSVAAGGGNADLVWASCATGINTNSVAVGVDVDGQLARIGTGSIDEGGSLDIDEISLSILDNTLPGSISIANIQARLDLELGGGVEQLQLEYSLHDGNPSSAHTEGGLSEANLNALDVNVHLLYDENEECSGFLGCLLDGIGDLVSDLVEGVTDLLGLENLIKTIIEDLVDALGTSLIEPLLNALGVSLGTMQVAVTGADQNHVRLLEYCGPDGC